MSSETNPTRAWRTPTPVGFVSDSYNMSKTELSRKYNLTLAQTIGILNRENIQIEKYLGNMTRISEKDFRDQYNVNPTIKHLTHYFGVSNSTVKKHLITYNLKFPQRTNEMSKAQKAYIKENFELIKYLNEKNHLYVIANSLNVSIEHLKSVCNSMNYVPKNLGYNKSKGEMEIYEFMRSIDPLTNSPKYKFDDKTYEIDVYSPTYKFGVEYCGEYWHSNQNHIQKHEWCKKQQISLFTLFEHEWQTKRPIIESMIRHRMNKSQRIFARDTVIKKISSEEARDFFNQNHLDGYIYSSYNFGLFHKNTLVMAISLSKSRFDKSYTFEITRVACKLNMAVVGGLSKLMSNVKEILGESIMTYSNDRYGGTGYSAVFHYIRKTPPGYKYFDKNTGETFSRMKYQRSKLSKILKVFDCAKTEKQNMLDNGFYILNDCGNSVYSVIKGV